MYKVFLVTLLTLRIKGIFENNETIQKSLKIHKVSCYNNEDVAKQMCSKSHIFPNPGLLSCLSHYNNKNFPFLIKLYLNRIEI